MIKYHRHTLDNGLRVILHHDATTPLVAINMLYDVGSRDEDPAHTGFAHLFEHLMFGGSEGAESFDDPIQNAGGDCNAFTNSDVTNFFSILPAENLPLGLFLEADRMQNLVLNEKVLDTQRKVVTEEFKETCLNQPYGDIWHVLAPLAYREHSYKWPTIGDKIEHITASTIDDVARFYKSYYGPNNAICVIAGNYNEDTIIADIEKFFGDIPARNRPDRNIPIEPHQSDERRLIHRSDIPVDTIFLAFHMPSRSDAGYYTADLISDLLAAGKSSRLYQALVREQELCIEADAYITGTIDPGLLIVEAKPANGYPLETIENAIWRVLDELKDSPVDSVELARHQNKIESSIHFSNCSILNKAMNLAFFELIGDIELINTEHYQYQRITAEEISAAARKLLSRENCSVLYYQKELTTESPIENL